MTDILHHPLVTKLTGWINSKVGRWITTSGAILFTFFVLGYLVYRQRDVLISYHWQIRLHFFAGAFLLYCPALFIASYVWTRIIRALGYHVNFLTHFRYYSISNLAKRLPATVWYVFYRNQMYQKEGLPAAVTSLASGIEFVVVLLSGILVVGLFAVPILLEFQMGVWGIAILLALAVIFFNPKIINWLLKKSGVSHPQFQYHKLVLWVSGYVLVRLLAGGLVFCIGNSIYSIPLESLPYIIGGWTLVGVLSSLLFFSPSNLGFNEVTFSLLLSKIMPSSIAVIIALLLRISLISFEAAWALFVLGFEGIRTKLTNK
jgi:uncharacterized membrane protein YbhN (UPF0104 family)